MYGLRLASLIPRLQPEIHSGQILPASSDRMFGRGLPSQSATAIDSRDSNAAFAPIDRDFPYESARDHSGQFLCIIETTTKGFKIDSTVTSHL